MTCSRYSWVQEQRLALLLHPLLAEDCIFATTCRGNAMAVAVGGNKTARVIRPDITEGSAVIHIVDAVLEV